jgi:hypothetical protein
MQRKMTTHRVGVSTALGLLALVGGGLALGSNMGFEITVPVVTGAPSPNGDNWISVPFDNPYAKASTLCTELGLISSGPSVGRAVVSRLSCTLGATQNYTCGTNTLLAFTLVKGEAIKVRSAVPIAAPVIGAHDPGFAVPLCGYSCDPRPPDFPAPKGDNWVSLPYHFAGQKANSVCEDAGLTSTGPHACRGVVSRLTASSGGLLNYTCGTNTVLAFSLTIGEGIRIRQGSVPAPPWTPSHW